jgi:2-polyprenyl-3-methyl-5-hydroxy-6-metoxy-1,4-benzoquinol methylase
MADLFQEKAQDWDMRDHVKALSDAIGTAILKKIPFSESMTAMDFGAGTGLISAHIFSKVKRIAAVDVSQSMLDKLLAKTELKEVVEVHCQDIIAEPLVSQYDVIVSAMALHHVENTAELIRVLAAHLRSGGYIALADLDKEDGDFHPANTEGVYHFGFERPALEKLMKEQGFHTIEFDTVHTIDKVGKPYPVFLLTARL